MRRLGQSKTQQVESPLDRRITELIARDLGVKPEEVTPELMSDWRRKNLYPNGTVKVTTRMGGYNGRHRRVPNGKAVAARLKRAEAFFLKYAG